MAKQGERCRRGTSVAAVTVMVAVTAMTGTSSASAADAGSGQRCADVGVVFARGSGQPLGWREAPRFFSKLSARLGPTRSVRPYELGADTHGGARYPAAGVGIDSPQELVNVLDAVAGVRGGTWRASVRTGVTELVAYLDARTERCPGERHVLGGYSQGANVVGDALGLLTPDVRARVAYVALFGDPKLHLPEGKGTYPPACQRRGRSPWRRGSVGCFTDNGILGPRVPYAPDDVATRVGSWCDRDDPICNGNPADLAISTHPRYGEDGAGMDEAVGEIAAALETRTI